MIRLGVIVLCCTTLFSTSAWAHGIVGRRSFVEPFVTEDANPKNEFVLGKPAGFESPEGREFSLGFALEKKLADSVSLGLESEWTDLSPRGEKDESGFQNLGILLKYAPIKSPAHELIVSFGLELAVPTGDRDVGAEHNPAVAPLLLFGKGFGDLPDVLAPLRPAAVMGDAGIDVLLSKESGGDALFYDVMLMYSIPYLESYVHDLGLPTILDDLIPVVEFNFETVVNGPERRTEAKVTPGLIYLGEYVELGIGGQFPLNDTSDAELDWGVLGIIDVFYDDLLPQLARWQF